MLAIGDCYIYSYILRLDSFDFTQSLPGALGTLCGVTVQEGIALVTSATFGGLLSGLWMPAPREAELRPGRGLRDEGALS